MAVPDGEGGVSYPHPRRIGWLGTTALALGGSNQCLFLVTALFIGQGDIAGQGSAAIPLLLFGLLLSYAAAPGWTELVLMYPDKVGGIAACCTAAFKPYNPVLSALAGACYWWGWVPTCGVTAILSATAIQQWCLPDASIPLIACAIVVAFTVINLCGVAVVSRFAVPIGLASAGLAFVSMLAPLLTGTVDPRVATDFTLTLPFPGWFGALTSMMAGLYLIGFGAPAFEAATCHVGETVDPVRNVKRAMLASGAMAAVYFAVLPVIWLGVLGPEALGKDLGEVLGPTFAPVFGGAAKSAAIGFMMFNMFHGTMQPLAGAARTLAQLSEDGLAPRFLAWRTPTDAPWTATLATAGFAVLFLLIGDPIWLIAAANFTYLIGIGLPSVAVWLLRRDAPDAVRLYRAPRGSVGLGLAAACIWGVSALLGFEQFGLPTVVIGLLLAYSGAALYAWRKIEDRWQSGLSGMGRSLHVKLTGAMLLVLALDAGGYMLAVGAIPREDRAFVTALEDIFVAVAMLTISVGIVLPGMIAHSAEQISLAARRLAFGTVHDFALAMDALGAGNLDAAKASVDIEPVRVHSRDELGVMADSFNALQLGISKAARGLDHAREGLSRSRADLVATNTALARTVREQERLTRALTSAKEAATFDATHDVLTGLPNRAYINAELQAALAATREGVLADWAVLFIDLDDFKIINDSLGHAAGNTLIVQVANRLGLLLHFVEGAETGAERAGRHILARLGGDEFVALVAGMPDAASAAAAAAKIQAAFTAPFVIDGMNVYTSASVGIAPNCAAYATSADILRDADLAMHRAKTLGKGRAEIYDATMHESVAKRMRLETDLRQALENDEFELHYQPIVALGEAEIIGFEALVRWRRPGVGLVPPGDFITAAEETGLIVPIGLWVLREACRSVRDWQAQMTTGRPLTMSVNLSPRQFAQHDILPAIRAVLAETGVDPALVKLEITESSTMGDPGRAVQVLTELRRLGLHLSIDDFGTGYSSLSHLHRFPLNVLKIDRSFIAQMTESAESLQMVTTILAMAEGMGMTVIAEGIESREQAAELRRLGCGFGQGYLFSRPVPATDVPGLLLASFRDRSGLATGAEAKAAAAAA